MFVRYFAQLLRVFPGLRDAPLQLICWFVRMPCLKYKMKSKMYRAMCVDWLADRLLTCRPLTFMQAQDAYVLKVCATPRDPLRVLNALRADKDKTLSPANIHSTNKKTASPQNIGGVTARTASQLMVRHVANHSKMCVWLRKRLWQTARLRRG